MIRHCLFWVSITSVLDVKKESYYDDNDDDNDNDWEEEDVLQQ